MTTPAYSELIERFGPIFDRIAETTVEREVTRRLPHREVEWLREAGFGAVRVPRELGGSGASIEQLFALLVELGAADSNLPQALRQHFFNVEMRILSATIDSSAQWIERIVAGDLFGNATTEPPTAVIGQISTVLTKHEGGGYRLNGTKVYTTGNLYAQWIPVVAVDESGTKIVVTVAADREGVRIDDDWNGFGQQHTSTGTTQFTDVVVTEDEINWHGEADSLLGAGFHQLVLLATIAGIGSAASRDVVREVRKRKRIFAGGSGELPRVDSIVQEAVGRIASTDAAVRAIVGSAARRLDGAWRLWNSEEFDFATAEQAFIDAEIEISTAQVAIIPLVLDATGQIFDVLGASATDRSLALDRHWRNARTVSSHNPHLYKARLVGDHVLNGARPPIFSAGADVGVSPAAAKEA